MRVVVQRSGNSEVIVNNNIVGKIDKGLVILVGFTQGDSLSDIEYLVKKIINLSNIQYYFSNYTNLNTYFFKFFNLIK